MSDEKKHIVPKPGSLVISKKQLASLIISAGALGFFINSMLGLLYWVGVLF